MTTADRPLRADARRNQAKLIAVAREAFAEHGVETPMDDIARRASVGPGTLYRHFPTRETLLAAVYREDIDAIADRADQLVEELPPNEALTAWFDEQLRYMSSKMGMGAAIKSMLGSDTVTMDYCRDRMRAAVRTVLEPAQRSGMIRDDVDPQVVLRMVHGIGVASESAPELAPQMLAILIDGLRPTN